MMEDLFVKPEEAKALKELGFKEECFAEFCTDAYGGHDLVFPHHKRQTRFNPIAAPTYQQALEWIKDKHSIWGVVLPTETLETWCYYWYNLEQKPRVDDEFLLDYFETYEQARLFLLQQLIKFITNKQKQ